MMEVAEVNSTIGKHTKKEFLKTRDSQRTFSSYLMLSPVIFGFVVFSLYPMIWVISKSLYYYVGIPQTQKFIGFDNFVTVFKSDAGYWKAWLNTLEFTIFKLPGEICLAIVLGVFLSRRMRGVNFFRSVYFMPQIISVAIVGIIFANLFDYFGYINAILSKLGIIGDGYDWFSTKKGAMTVLVIGSVWQCVGLNAMYVLAGIQNIDKDLYEAADIDGASKFRQFWSITLPLLAPVLQIIILLGINGTLQTNDYVLVMTNGAPGGATNTVMSYLTKKFMPGFATDSVINVGYGSAVYAVSSVIYCFVAIVYSKLSDKLNNLY